MKRLGLLIIIFNLMGCSTQDKVTEVDFTIDNFIEYYNHKKGIYVRRYEQKEDTLLLKLSRTENEKIIKLYNKYNLQRVRKSYHPNPKRVEIPSLPPLCITINDTIKIEIPDGEYTIAERIKMRNIKSFYSDVMKIIRKNESVNSLEESDIIFI